MKRSTVFVLATVLAGCTSKPASSPAPAPSPSPVTQEPARGAVPPVVQARDSASDTTGGRGAGVARPRPYNRVITAEARTRRGLFAVHRVNDRLYFESPRRERGRGIS
jgi:hypothetical protein